MNELTPGALDQAKFDQNIPYDTRKPLRSFIDDKLMPYAGPALAIPLGAVGAIGGIINGASAAPRQIQIK